MIFGFEILAQTINPPEPRSTVQIIKREVYYLGEFNKPRQPSGHPKPGSQSRPGGQVTAAVEVPDGQLHLLCGACPEEVARQGIAGLGGGDGQQEERVVVGGVGRRAALQEDGLVAVGEGELAAGRRFGRAERSQAGIMVCPSTRMY